MKRPITWPAARLPFPPVPFPMMEWAAEVLDSDAGLRKARAVIAMDTAERTGIPREWLAGVYAPEDLTPPK